jgi:hypothetical protein
MAKRNNAARGQPWDIPPNPPVGDPTETDVYAAVGHALSNWERLEHQMSNIFTGLISRAENPIARSAYGSVMVSSIRAEMLDGAAHAFFATLILARNEKAKARFVALKAELDDIKMQHGRFLSRRNNIAHGIVSLYFPDGPDGSGYCLVPPLYATKHYRKTLVYPYAFTAKFINGFAREFYTLGERANRFAVDPIFQTG